MLLACLIGGAVIGYVVESFVQPSLASVTLGGYVAPATIGAILTAFVGGLWGWSARGVFTTAKPEK
jgi:hypothetical protein